MRTAPYLETGEQRSKAKNVRYFRELPLSTIWRNTLKETGRVFGKWAIKFYRKYDAEIWMVIAFGSIALNVWYRLGQK